MRQIGRVKEREGSQKRDLEEIKILELLRGLNTHRKSIEKVRLTQM